jgi:hypothetical protein
MIWFPKSGCPVLANLAYVSSNFNCCDPPIMCNTYYMFTHTKLLHFIGCIDIGGALLDFLERCAKWHL